MSHTPDPRQTATGDEPLDPPAAAAVLNQATQQARRRFQPPATVGS
jgi:hypothetical protein